MVLQSHSHALRLRFVNASHAVNEAIARHNVGDANTAQLLGRTMTASLLLSSMLKGEERVIVDVQEPQGRRIYAESMPNGEIRSMVTGHATNAPATLASDALLRVTRVLYNHAAPVTSILPIVSGDVVSDVTGFLFRSDQVPTALHLETHTPADWRALADAAGADSTGREAPHSVMQASSPAWSGRRLGGPATSVPAGDEEAANDPVMRLGPIGMGLPWGQLADLWNSTAALELPVEARTEDSPLSFLAFSGGVMVQQVPGASASASGSGSGRGATEQWVTPELMEVVDRMGGWRGDLLSEDYTGGPEAGEVTEGWDGHLPIPAEHAWMANAVIAGQTPQESAQQLLPELGGALLHDKSVFASPPVAFHCRCSKAGFLERLHATMSQDDLVFERASAEQRAQSGQPQENLICHVCNARYELEPSDFPVDQAE